MEALQLNLFLQSLGDVVPLNFLLDCAEYSREVQKFSDHFHPYNPRKLGYKRSGLSLTSLDGKMGGVPDLDSLREYNRLNGTQFSELDFKTPTPAFLEMSTLRRVREELSPWLSRTHIIRFDKGGYFPPHRDDASLEPETFRLLFPLVWAPDGYVFMIDDKRIHLEGGRGYFLNTVKNHCVFSFSDKVDLLVINLDLKRAAVDWVLENLRQV